MKEREWGEGRSERKKKQREKAEMQLIWIGDKLSRQNIKTDL